jgi:hypothetical protein
MDEIIKKCKAGVYFEANKYKDYYDTIETAISEINSQYKEIEDELVERMIKENQLLSLQFYPDTPVGFYKVYGTTFEEVVKKALEILKDV